MDKNLKRDILQWDVKSWGHALDYWEKNASWEKLKTGLELGGREGGLSLLLASHGIDTICSDLKDSDQSAGPLHSKYKCSNLIRYKDIDASNIPYENHFDVIAFKSIIGGIGRNGQKELQQKVFSEIYKALKPGGQLLFAENLVASPLHNFMRKKFIKWSEYWRYVNIDEMKEFMSSFSRIDIRSCGFSAAFGRSEKQRNFLSAIDNWLLNKIIPQNWKYIAYGIAYK